MLSGDRGHETEAKHPRGTRPGPGALGEPELPWCAQERPAGALRGSFWGYLQGLRPRGPGGKPAQDPLRLVLWTPALVVAPTEAGSPQSSSIPPAIDRLGVASGDRDSLEMLVAQEIASGRVWREPAPGGPMVGAGPAATSPEGPGVGPASSPMTCGT